MKRAAARIGFNRTGAEGLIAVLTQIYGTAAIERNRAQDFKITVAAAAAIDADSQGAGIIESVPDHQLRTAVDIDRSEHPAYCRPDVTRVKDGAVGRDKGTLVADS